MSQHLHFVRGSESTIARVVDLPELDLTSMPLVKADLEKEMENKPAIFILDISTVSFVDSSGLGVVALLSQKMESAGGKFALVGVAEKIFTVLRQTKLNERIKIFTDKDEALKALA